MAAQGPLGVGVVHASGRYRRGRRKAGPANCWVHTPTAPAYMCGGIFSVALRCWSTPWGHSTRTS